MFLKTTEQTHRQDLERLKLLRYMDDDFMTVCLADNFEGVELILGIILGRSDIKVKAVRTQEIMKNLQGRFSVLDVHAVDSTGKEFDVEIQRSDAGAGAKRARYFKQDEKGAAAMCKLLEDMRKEAAREAELNKAKKTAVHLIRLDRMTLQEIAEATELPFDVVRELETEVVQPV